MRFYFNEVSIQRQFVDEEQFKALVGALLAARSRSPILAAMRTTPALAERPVSHARTFRQVVQTWRGSPIAAAVFAWVGRNGPFIEDDRLAEVEDLFICLGIEVTDGGLGEAARRSKAMEAVAAMSFPAGDPDFARTPLPVVHRFEDAPIATYEVPNYWDADAALGAALAIEPSATTWRATVEAARHRFPHLMLPDALYENPLIARDPFDAVIRDRIYALLGILNAYMDDRDDQGEEGETAREIVRTHFQGDRALFSPESRSNRQECEDALTFPDPLGGRAIFAHWHGKISHRFYRIHFEWPVPAGATRLKVLYIGPKLTKK